MTAPLRLAHATGHAIETLTWTSHGDIDRETAHAYQARLSRFLNGTGRDIIARVFSQLSPPDELWQLDSLEIDTGPMSPSGSDAQWALTLERQLIVSLLRARQQLIAPAHAAPIAAAAVTPATGTAPRPADHQALEHFVFYLQRGHLPWSLSPMAGRELSTWLALLARRTGPRLWSILQQLRPGDYVLARLSRITPHQGLQALIGVRYRELADSLGTLDAQVLAPLQARGRLSAYQVQQIQQAWRVSAFRILWDQRAGNLSADGLRRLQRELGAVLARHLGQGGLGAWRPARQRADRSGAGTRLDHLLLGGLLAAAERPGRASGQGGKATTPRTSSARQAGTPSAARAATPVRRERPVDAALRRLGAALDGSGPLGGEALHVLLDDLHARAPADLRTHLQGLALRRGQTTRWLGRLGSGTVWRILRVLAGDAPAHRKPMRGPARNIGHEGVRGDTHGGHWAESLRQFSLATLSRGARPGKGRRTGVSALQAWLAAYTLRQLSLGERAPTDQRGWQRFWQRAVEAWQHGAARPRPPVVARRAEVPPAADTFDIFDPFESMPAPRARHWHALHTVTTIEARLDHLAAFTRVPMARRDWVMRNQLSEWLADPVLCDEWLAITPAAKRWALIGALRPREVGTLRRTSRVLQTVQAVLLPARAPAERTRSHWRFLTEHLFVTGLPVTPASLARRYALHLCREQAHEAVPAPSPGQPVTVPTGRGASLRQWIARVASALASWRWLGSPEPTKAAVVPAPAERILRRAPSAVEQWEASQPLRAQAAGKARGGSAAHAMPEDPIEMRPPEIGDTHYVGNAGLVLLANYAPQLFTMLKLLDGSKLRDAAATSRAVRCLSYLIEGHDGASEPECVLPKLLCGMPLSAPLSAGEDDDDVLDDATRKVLDSLLDAVISHWKAIGHTSREGLRQTFLQREGRLARESTENGTHWRLVVKPAPFDMLMDRLPWSFGTVKLPWMQEALYVDWR